MTSLILPLKSRFLLAVDNDEYDDDTSDVSSSSLLLPSTDGTLIFLRFFGESKLLIMLSLLLAVDAAGDPASDRFVIDRDLAVADGGRGARLSRPPLRKRGRRRRPARVLGDDLLDDVFITGVLLDAGVPPGEDAEAAEHGRRYGRHEVVDLDDLADVEAVGEDEVVVVGVEGHVAGAGRVGEAEVKAVVA